MREGTPRSDAAESPVPESRTPADPRVAEPPVREVGPNTSTEKPAGRESRVEPPAGAPGVEPAGSVRPPRERESQPRESQPQAEALPPEPQSEPGVAGQPDAAAVRAVWSEVSAKVRERSRTVEVMLSGATVPAIAGNVIVLHHDSGPLAKRLVEPRNADVLREVLRDVFGVDWEVRCESGPGAAAPDAPPRRSDPPKQPKPQGPKFSRPSRTRSAPPAQPAGPPRRSAPSRNDGPPPEEFPPPDEPPPPYDEPPYDAAPPDTIAPSSSNAPSGGTAPTGSTASPGNTAPPPYDDGPPPPPTAAEEEEMLAEAAQPVPPEGRRDPDEVALELLQNELGAKPID